MPRPRVAIVASLVPHDCVPHAGGQYLKALCDVAAEDADVTLLAANTEANKAAAASPGAPEPTVLVGREFGGGVAGKVLGRLTVNLDPKLRQRDQGMAYLPFVVGMRTLDQARQVIRRADVVDLQWQDVIRFLPYVRRLNPRARVVGMFHDVHSQSFGREALPGDPQESYWLEQADRARTIEQRLIRSLDVVGAFSEKDLALLGNPPNGLVIRPPVAAGIEVEGRPHPRVSGRHPGTPPTVLCVSYLRRFENDDAVRWLLTDIWPAVLSQVPDARLRIAGAGAQDGVVTLAAMSSHVELLGYVDDLEPEYDRADVVVVPLRFGAGVKFKTVDALVRGVPVVTTPVGAEGIAEGARAESDLFGRVSADASEVAAALVGILTDPVTARARAARAREWSITTFGRQAFREAVHTAYGWGAGRFGGTSD